MVWVMGPVWAKTLPNAQNHSKTCWAAAVATVQSRGECGVIDDRVGGCKCAANDEDAAVGSLNACNETSPWGAADYLPSLLAAKRWSTATSAQPLGAVLSLAEFRKGPVVVSVRQKRTQGCEAGHALVVDGTVDPGHADLWTFDPLPEKTGLLVWATCAGLRKGLHYAAGACAYYFDVGKGENSAPQEIATSNECSDECQSPVAITVRVGQSLRRKPVATSLGLSTENQDGEPDCPEPPVVVKTVDGAQRADQGVRARACTPAGGGRILVFTQRDGTCERLLSYGATALAGTLISARKSLASGQDLELWIDHRRGTIEISDGKNAIDAASGRMRSVP